jgi:hypothetical protein
MIREGRGVLSPMLSRLTDTPTINEEPSKKEVTLTPKIPPRAIVSPEGTVTAYTVQMQIATTLKR